MSPALISALALFAFASSITPGPNNMMLLASGANFGLRATVPHFLGVVVGFSLLLLAVGLGLGGLFAAYPVLHDVLKWAGAAYLLWLAWKIATAKGIGAGKKGDGGKPMTFLQAVAFQAVNVKAWAMALGFATTYLPRQGYLPALLIGVAVFAAVNAPCVAMWASFGVGLRRFLDRPKVLRAFNVTMAVLLVASLYPLFF